MASTFLATTLLEGRTGALGEFKPDAYAKAVAATGAHLTDGDVPLLFDPSAILARMKALAEQVAELRDTVAALNLELAQVKKSLADLQAKVDAMQASPSPAPTAAPTGAQTAGVASLVETFAGLRDTTRSPDGVGTAASFNNPCAIALDAAGNAYVADQSNHKIRKITPDGTVSTVAGTGSAGTTDGAASSAQFNNPYGVALDGFGNLFVADLSNNRIRKIRPAGQVGTFAGSSSGYREGDGGTALFRSPAALAFAPQGRLYVADSGNYCVRRLK